MGEIEDKVHLSPAEAEIGAELGNSYFFKREEGWKHSVKSETCPKLNYPPESLSRAIPCLQKLPYKEKQLTGYGTI